LGFCGVPTVDTTSVERKIDVLAEGEAMEENEEVVALAGMLEAL
jgi:hypothetical protein